MTTNYVKEIIEVPMDAFSDFGTPFDKYLYNFNKALQQYDDEGIETDTVRTKTIEK